MGVFSKTSKDRLATCDARLQRVMTEVVKYFDCTVIEGHRGQAAQDKAFADGTSQLKWPNGKHNSYPSKAVDVAPYPVVWPNKKSKTYLKDLARWYFFAGFVLGVARGMGITLRSGADWDGDTDLTDQSFDDLPHFEIVE